jgi:hypothetical protein
MGNQQTNKSTNNKHHTPCNNPTCGSFPSYLPQQSLPQQPQFYQIDEIKGKEEMEMEENKEMVYKGILDYYSVDLIFTKVENKRLNGKSYSIYYAKLDCMLLCNDKRYLIAIVPYDMTLGGNEMKLSNLKWVSFQTIIFIQDPVFKIKRLTEQGEHTIDLELKGQNYNVNDNTFVKSIIEIESRKDDKSIYIATKYPLLQIALFNNKKNGGKNEYANKTTIASALETFTCVLSFV